MQVRLIPALAAAAAFAMPAAVSAEPSDLYEIKSEVVVEGLDHPWGLAFLPDGAMLITERGGDLRLVENGTLVEAPVSGTPAVWADGQGGLLDVALDPDFETNGLVYLSFSEPGEDETAGTAIARGTLIRDQSGARLEAVDVIYRQTPKTDAGVHFGSRLAFAPDGRLFATLGDRGDRDKAQDLGTPYGKVIRLERDGAIPADNPFLKTDGARPEIWSYGHRNPQGAAIDSATGTLWTVEHGARGGDEINQPAAGINHGWPVITYGRNYSGFSIGIGTEAPNMAQPIHYWDPSIAPSGLTVYRGKLFEQWQGDLFVGGLRGQVFVRLDVDNQGKVVGEERLFSGTFGRIRDVREGPDGAIYLLTDESPGALIRLSPASPS